ncbi:hypothetical protein [Ralstonia sp. 1B3]|uniref:hypothetical protein n=1 Tax=Ralstonia sp. 1B3 TaxID=2997421 RepID=UPI002FCB879D
MPFARPPLLKAIPICLILAACGGGGDDAASTPPPSATQPVAPIGSPVSPVSPVTPIAPASYTIAGTVTGLLDYGSLTLLNNGADPIVQAADGGFSFPVPVAAGAPTLSRSAPNRSGSLAPLQTARGWPTAMSMA